MSSSIDLVEEFIKENIDRYNNGVDRLSDVAYECLKDAILNLDVQAGDPLPEKRLSTAFNISRTPMRTAIQRLTQDGLLQIIPGLAVVIAGRSTKQMLDALRVRSLLEPEVCRLVAAALSDEQREQLRDYTDKLTEAVEARDRAAWGRTDIKWHTLLYEACPNELLSQMVLQAYHRMRTQGVISHISQESLIPGTQEHRDIADAILEGDGERAAELMKIHLGSAHKRMLLSDF